jgi:hypothetical protein
MPQQPQQQLLAHIASPQQQHPPKPPNHIIHTQYATRISNHESSFIVHVWEEMYEKVENPNGTSKVQRLHLDTYPAAPTELAAATALHAINRAFNYIKRRHRFDAAEQCMRCCTALFNTTTSPVSGCSVRAIDMLQEADTIRIKSTVLARLNDVINFQDHLAHLQKCDGSRGQCSSVITHTNLATEKMPPILN